MRISEAHLPLLTDIRRSRKGLTGMELFVKSETPGIYVHLGRMVRYGWLSRHPQAREGGGSALVRYRLTQLGKLALKYGLMEREA